MITIKIERKVFKWLRTKYFTLSLQKVAEDTLLIKNAVKKAEGDDDVDASTVAVLEQYYRCVYERRAKIDYNPKELHLNNVKPRNL